MRWPTVSLAWIAGLKWVVYAALCAAAVFFLIRYWSIVCAALADLLLALQEFWQRLTGGKRVSASRTAAERESFSRPLPSFSHFVDPFGSGAADLDPPEKIVQVSFAAVEAWARDRGMPRRCEQTVDAFLRDLTDHFPRLGPDLKRLGVLYSTAAYAGAPLARPSVMPLKTLWSCLREA
jgi:hypothetical protein